MDGTRQKDIREPFPSHKCERCKDIIFTLGGSTSFSLEDVQRADKAGCEFFRLIYQKYLVTKIATVPISSRLVIDCSEGGGLDIRWVDGATILFDSGGQSTSAFQMFASKGSPAAVDIENRPLNLTPGSPEQIHRIRKCLDLCRREHKECMRLRKTHRQQCPARLIRVGDSNSKDVCISVPVSGSPVKYAILSYCWGGEQESKTTSARLEQRRNGFSLKDLPQTIQDAVFLTRKLRLEYLWVDAICIIQDDEDDKEREVKRMDQIYRGASITLVAARAKKVSEGFLMHRNPSQCYGTVFEVQYRPSSADPAIVRSSSVSAEPLDITYDEPIDKRGWTFQERYQSFRTVRFGSKQTVWDCPTSCWVDGGINYTFEASSDRLFTGTIADSPDLYRLDDPSGKEDLESVLAD